MTGGSGYIGSYCIIKCLNSGYRVRTTIRSLKREQEVRDMVADGKASHLDRLSFAEADLNRDDGWREAVEGCAYVLHVASPFPSGPPRHEDELIKPAREGTLRVLRAAEAAGVRRVVVTSSMNAISAGYTAGNAPKVFTEETWADISLPGTAAYQKSKSLAERAAWDFIGESSSGMELTVVNPGLVIGPVLGRDNSTSISAVLRQLNGQNPGLPRLVFALVDVRDVADLHVLAMEAACAGGQRYLGAADSTMSMVGIARTLRERLSAHESRKVSTMVVPDALVRLLSWFDSEIALIVPDLGLDFTYSSDKAKRDLGWQPREVAQSVEDSARSLIDHGLAVL